MNINQAKEEVKNAVRVYLQKDEAGQYEIPNYWSSVPSSGYDNDAGYLYFYLIYHGTYNFDRYHGQSVRPVQDFTE